MKYSFLSCGERIPPPVYVYRSVKGHFEIYNNKKYEECLAVRDVTSRARKKSKVR